MGPVLATNGQRSPVDKIRFLGEQDWIKCDHDTLQAKGVSPGLILAILSEVVSNRPSEIGFGESLGFIKPFVDRPLFHIEWGRAGLLLAPHKRAYGEVEAGVRVNA